MNKIFHNLLQNLIYHFMVIKNYYKHCEIIFYRKFLITLTLNNSKQKQLNFIISLRSSYNYHSASSNNVCLILDKLLYPNIDSIINQNWVPKFYDIMYLFAELHGIWVVYLQIYNPLTLSFIIQESRQNLLYMPIKFLFLQSKIFTFH